jgi:hypothetical protein
MDEACSKHGRDDKCINTFGQKPEGEETTRKT